MSTRLTTAPCRFGQVAASDPDAPVQMIVAYDILTPNVPFTIDNNGNLFSDGNLDFETTSSYTFTVQVTDNDIPQQTGLITIIVDVNNINEPPVLDPITYDVEENTPIGTKVNTAPIRAVDPEGNAVGYTIVGGNVGNAFELRPAIGGGVDLFVDNSTVLDFEQRTVINLVLRVTDNGIPSASADVPVTINILDVDELPTSTHATRRAEFGTPIDLQDLTSLAKHLVAGRLLSIGRT